MAMQAKNPIAAVTALALAVISLACVMSCWTPQPAMAPCHQHSSNSCAPLLLTAETPQPLLAADPAYASASATFIPAAVEAERGSKSEEVIAYARLDDISPYGWAVASPLFALRI